MAYFDIKFDGDIVQEHKLSLRVMGKTYNSMQSSIDRSFLANLHGNVWKYAKLKNFQYPETEFIAEYPEKGSIKLSAFKDNADLLIDKIYSTILPIFERASNQGIEDTPSFLTQIAERIDYANAIGENLPNFNEWALDLRDQWAFSYSTRSIAKEVDQLVMQISRKDLHTSTLDIHLHGSSSYPVFGFTNQIAKRFHKIVSVREVGPVVRLSVIVTSLDRGHKIRKPGAKAINLENDKEFILHLHTDANASDEVHKIHDKGRYNIYAAPIMEAGGFDVNRGDYIFLGIA